MEEGRSGWWVMETLEAIPVSSTATVTVWLGGQAKDRAAQAWGALIWVKGQLGLTRLVPQLRVRVALVK